MFDGNEAEGKIGNFGGYTVDVNDKGIIRAEMKASNGGGMTAGAFAEIDLLVELKKLAAMTTNKIDDGMVAMIAAALGRE